MLGRKQSFYGDKLFKKKKKAREITFFLAEAVTCIWNKCYISLAESGRIILKLV